MGAITDGSYQIYIDPMLDQKLSKKWDAEKELVSNSIFGLTTGLVSGDLLNPIKTLGSIFCGIGKKSASSTETTSVVQQPEETPTEESVEDTTNNLNSFMSDLKNRRYINKSGIAELIAKYEETDDPTIKKVLKQLKGLNLTSNDNINLIALYNNLYRGDRRDLLL
ncbi:MAG: hypothetical protein Q4E83_08705 [bacterium]|nr:hypothetical protein [bacterium]